MTDISKEYVAKVLYASPFADNETGIPQMCDSIEAQAARIAELEAQCVTVKPLEWREDVVGDFYAETEFCKYEVSLVRGEGWCAFIRDGDVLCTGINLDPDAKAEAQADCERRILSAITTQSTDAVWNAAIEAAAGVALPSGVVGDKWKPLHMRRALNVSLKAILALKRNNGDGDALE